MRARWLVLVLGATFSSVALSALPPALADGERLPSLAPMLEEVTPAVVNIATYTTVEVRNPLLEDPFFRRFFNIPDTRRRYRRAQSAGSGVVVDAERGYIVTNNHVIGRADQIIVGLADGRTMEATLVGRDPQVDLAVLEVDAQTLTEIAFADSADLRVGDFVVAIGNPFGLDQTVTSGIVSALGRSGLHIEGLENFIQTDASINPGNSGGALVDLAGRLVGLNTAILAPSGGNIGIGFAIPSNMVRAIMKQIIEHGEVRRGDLGLIVQPLNFDLAEALGVDWREGVVVVEVTPGGPTDEAGLEPGDVIVRVNDREVQHVSDFRGESAVIMVGDTAEMEVIRDGESRVLQVHIERDSFEKIDGERLDPRFAGTVLQSFRDQRDRSLDAGVLVTQVEPRSRASQAGLRSGDIIVAANRQPARNLSELTDALRRSGSQILLRVYRAGEFGYIVLR